MINCLPTEHAWGPRLAPFLEPEVEVIRECCHQKNSETGPSPFYAHATGRILHKIYSCRDPDLNPFSFMDSWGDFVFNLLEPHVSSLEGIAQAGNAPKGQDVCLVCAQLDLTGITGSKKANHSQFMACVHIS